MANKNLSHLSYSEMEIRRIMFQGQPWGKSKTPISTNKSGMVAHSYNPTYAEAETGRTAVQAGLNKNTRHYPKNN
jgi:hypothetical protein